MPKNPIHFSPQSAAGKNIYKATYAIWEEYTKDWTGKEANFPNEFGVKDYTQRILKHLEKGLDVASVPNVLPLELETKVAECVETMFRETLVEAVKQIKKLSKELNYPEVSKAFYTT